MIHLLIIYQFILTLLAVTVLVLVSIVKRKLNYLNSFFNAYLFFTILIFLDLLMTYSNSNIIIIPNIRGYYGYIVFLSSLFYMFYYYLMKTFHLFFKINRPRLFKFVKWMLVISFILVVSPISIKFSEDLNYLNIKDAYYISFLPYLFTSLYIVIFITQNLRIGKIKKRDLSFIISLSFFSIVCFLQALYTYYIKIVDPVIPMKINSDNRGFIESNIYFFILSIFVIYYCINNITIKDRVPDIEHFFSLGLTQRESEVSILIAKDLNNKQIIEELNISSSTLKTHINNIFRKTNTSNRKEFIKYKCKV